MSSELNGSHLTPAGQRVPTSLLLNAIRYEAARAVIFEDWGDTDSAQVCIGLKCHYERRRMEECSAPPHITSPLSNISL